MLTKRQKRLTVLTLFLYLLAILAILGLGIARAEDSNGLGAPHIVTISATEWAKWQDSDEPELKRIGDGA